MTTGRYGYRTRDGIEVHLSAVPDTDRRTSAVTFSSTDQLAEGWRTAGVHVHPPEDTEREA
jgi:hypothetical protein